MAAVGEGSGGGGGGLGGVISQRDTAKAEPHRAAPSCLPSSDGAPGPMRLGAPDHPAAGTPAGRWRRRRRCSGRRLGAAGRRRAGARPTPHQPGAELAQETWLTFLARPVGRRGELPLGMVAPGGVRGWDARAAAAWGFPPSAESTASPHRTSCWPSTSQLRSVREPVD